MNNLEVQIGNKAKKLRQDMKITLKELSKRTGLSVGYLSQFERGINTIAIDALDKIANVYGVDLSYFIPQSNIDVPDSYIIKSYQRQPMGVIGDNYIVKSLSTDPDHNVIYPRVIEILPQVSANEIQVYPHEGEEFIYVLEGILTLLINGTKHLLYPGDSAQYPSTNSHNWSNETNKLTKIICVSTPNPFNTETKSDKK